MTLPMFILRSKRSPRIHAVGDLLANIKFGSDRAIASKNVSNLKQGYRG
jgi:hypothetical protein